MAAHDPAWDDAEAKLAALGRPTPTTTPPTPTRTPGYGGTGSSGGPTPPVATPPPAATSTPSPAPTGSSSGLKPGGGKKKMSSNAMISALGKAGKDRAKKKERGEQDVRNALGEITAQLKKLGHSDDQVAEIYNGHVAEIGGTPVTAADVAATETLIGGEGRNYRFISRGEFAVLQERDGAGWKDVGPSADPAKVTEAYKKGKTPDDLGADLVKGKKIGGGIFGFTAGKKS